MPGKKDTASGLLSFLKRGGSDAAQGASELAKMLLAYTKQEALDPVVAQLKALGYGVAGAVLLALGTVLLSVGFLRALQSELGPARGPAHPYGTVGALSGDWSWAPYMGATLVCIAIAAWCTLRIVRGVRG
ncbi:MAG TPA: hypothetical protein VFN61_03895 [Acidimicrobiales bacterium]|nr:hypothetical protein [Acidimicrobiales bacterium]